MNTKTQQAERTSVEPVATRSSATRQHSARTAMAIVTIAIGAALTALVIGVTGGTGTEAPPSPGFVPPYGNELPPKGLDQRLYFLAEKPAAEREARMRLAPGADQRLYNLAEE